MLRPMIITTHYGDQRLSREFWAKTRNDEQTGCWIWTDRVSKTGTPMHGSKVAWRFAHERLVGPLVRGSVGRRACGESLCVNPAHRVTEIPKACPTCGHKLAQDTRAEIYSMSDGRVAVSVVSDDPAEPTTYGDLAPTKFATAEAGNWQPTSAPKPEDDPNHVPYQDGDERLTQRMKKTGRRGSPNYRYETTGGRWVLERQMTRAQESHLLSSIGNDDQLGDDWVVVE